MGRDVDHGRQLRMVLHVVPALPACIAGGVGAGAEGSLAHSATPPHRESGRIGRLIMANGNKQEDGLLGIFAEVDAAVEAIEKLRAAGLKRIVTFSPLPSHDLEHALHPPQSPVRMFTLIGGLTGAATGFTLPTWTSLDWPLVTGGKPIISIPPMIVIAFELTILFAALSTIAGLFINAR